MRSGVTWWNRSNQGGGRKTDAGGKQWADYSSTSWYFTAPDQCNLRVLHLEAWQWSVWFLSGRGTDCSSCPSISRVDMGLCLAARWSCRYVVCRHAGHRWSLKQRCRSAGQCAPSSLISAPRIYRRNRARHPAEHFCPFVLVIVGVSASGFPPIKTAGMSLGHVKMIKVLP